MEMQLRELEVKLTQTQNKEVETYEYLQSTVDQLKMKLDEDKHRNETMDIKLRNELESFESQVNMQLAKQKHVS